MTPRFIHPIHTCIGASMCQKLYKMPGLQWAWWSPSELDVLPGAAAMFVVALTSASGSRQTADKL